MVRQTTGGARTDMACPSRRCGPGAGARFVLHRRAGAGRAHGLSEPAPALSRPPLDGAGAAGAGDGEDPGALVLERRCERCGELHPASPLGAGAGGVWWSASSSAGLAAVAISRLARRARPRAAARAAALGADRPALLQRGRVARGGRLPGSLPRVLDAEGGLPQGPRPGPPRGPALARVHRPGAGGRRVERQRGAPGLALPPLRSGPGFIAAVAVEGTPDSIELRRWTPDVGEAR